MHALDNSWRTCAGTGPQRHASRRRRRARAPDGAPGAEPRAAARRPGHPLLPMGTIAASTNTADTQAREHCEPSHVRLHRFSCRYKPQRASDTKAEAAPQVKLLAV